MEKDNIILEACVETLEQCIAAEKRGVGRLELCDRLDLDGTTPAESLIRAVMNSVKIPVRVIIRPRGGIFVCTADEIEQMRKSIILCKSIGVDGVVFGILDKHNELDIAAMLPLIELAKPLNVVIHKAIDLTPDLFASMQKLQTIPGVNAILTSGKSTTALEGAALLRKMCDPLKSTLNPDNNTNNLSIIVAGRVTYENLSHLHRLIGASQYHGKLL